MRVRTGQTVVAIALALTAAGALANEALASAWRRVASDILYLFGADGSYSGRVTVNGGDGSRWACRPTGCTLCGSCHSSAQEADPTHVAKYDAGRHRKVHFPGLTMKLEPRKTLAWSTNAYLRLHNGDLAVASRSTGKDFVIFPTGFTILRNANGEAHLIALPATAEPRFLP